MEKVFEVLPAKGTVKKIEVHTISHGYLIIEEESLGRESQWLCYFAQSFRKYKGARRVSDLATVGPAVATVRGGHKKARGWGGKGGYAPAKERPLHCEMNYNLMMQNGWRDARDPSTVEEIPVVVLEAMGIYSEDAAG